jgi:uncharacterized damage-inducible protein DinB
VNTQSENMILEFIHYNNWANQQVLAACQNLSDDQLATGMPGAYGTIRDTLEHILRAEAGYVRLLTGVRPLPAFKWEDRPDLAALTEYAAQVGEALVDTAQRIQPTAVVNDEWDGKPMQYQALAIFIQIIDHGIEHRTNITTILNQGLYPHPDVDGWSYLIAQPDRFDKR